MARESEDPSPATWAPPRGPRDPRTGQRPAWAARPDSSYSDDAEREVVGAWRALVEVVADERYARGWGLRRLASQAGVVLSVVNDIEAGSTWPRLGTVEAIAGALGFVLEVEPEPGHPVLEGLMRQVRRQRRRDGTTPRQLAEYAGVRPNTLYELPGAVAGGSVRTLLVLARQLDVTVRLVRCRGANVPG
ncbi:helix-turn-helix domain-containing protein [Janibacter sp. G56]|uniref:helix-turn-helix domain-containing protein n=1 Tax=Janibacter sp. G56 TaxID=3418717 RepID=UPI003CFC7372